MSESNRHVNSFHKGMKRGIDAAQLNNDSYDYSLNGRFIFNEEGTWAWENTLGTKFAFFLDANYGNSSDYKPIGSAYINGTLVIISTNNTNGEIGLVRENQYGQYTYQTAFNDLYDPNGDNLRLSLQWDCVVDAIQENNLIESIYWNDDKNEPRVFNFISGADFNYAPPYPSWYSVHGMASMPDLTWGLIKYRENIAGGLLSGQRQYAYRYIHQTGYASPWSYLSQFVLLTADPVGGNWTDYQMGSSGVATSKGHRLNINFLDQRFQKIEVAALYWETDTSPQSASIIWSGNITGDEVTVDHVSDSGQAITVDELVQKFINIKNAKTQGIHYDNFYHMGNIEVYGDLPIDTSIITAEPVIRRILSDELGPTETLPLTNQAPKTTTVTLPIFDGAGGSIDQTHVVFNDYISYKGTQWCFMFKGYFRRETYPFAIVIWNRKGQPLFAQHITDYTLPEQWNNNFTDARLSGTTTGTVGSVGDYVLTDYDPSSNYPITDDIEQESNIVLQILGMNFGNIDLTDILFDSNGVLQVSGFSIVRMDRFASIVGQGIMCNTVRNSTDICNYTDEVRPLASAYNYLRTDAANPTNIYVGQMQNDCALNARLNWMTFECPDFFINEALFLGASTEDRIMLVGGVQPAFKAPPFQDGLTHYATTAGNDVQHYYNKNYFTPISNWTSILDGVTENAVSGFGNLYHMERIFANATDINGIDGGTLFWRQYSGIQNYLFGESDYDYSAIAHKNTLLLNSELQTCSLRQDDFHCCHYIVNYLQPVAAQAVTQVALENRVYYGIGHFIPINATTLAAAFDGTRYIFNNVQVWGGDCFVDYFSLCRLTPGYFLPGFEHVADCGHYNVHSDPFFPDYAIGIIFPIESRYNHSLRAGDDYAKVGSKPMSTYCGDTSEFNEGIYYAAEDNQKPEDFNVNSVLQAHDLIDLYNAKKELLKPEITDFPLLEIHSLEKFYGENFDSYRKFLVNNQQFADGEFGEIVAIRQLFGSLYCLQRNSLARIRFNERQLVNTANGDVNTGTAPGYAGHDYISTEFGCQHQFSIVNNSKSLYFPDAEKGKWLRFGQDGVNNLSDNYDARWMQKKLREYWYVKNEAGLLEAPFYDNPTYVGGIVGTYDYKNNSVILTFTKRLESIYDSDEGEIVEVGEAVTIEYSEQLNTFQTYHSFTPQWYFRMKQNYLSLKNGGNNRVYAHDEGIKGFVYDEFFESRLRFIANPMPQQSKVFDNGLLEVTGAVNIVKQMLATTNLNTQQVITLNDEIADDRPEYREGILTYPLMALDQETRLRGQYCIMEYVIDNHDDLTARITSHTTKFRLSSRV